jgi:hypothetical protein
MHQGHLKKKKIFVSAERLPSPPSISIQNQFCPKKSPTEENLPNHDWKHLDLIVIGSDIATPSVRSLREC